ncbi:hypothetical protein BV25DRAFT_684768 [Artomyces pyxidatus]|uniref:Uncharacterized protein n=1 Tax=Artomyces pyxidatus TaxID=48021 RepID=A0ACB8T1T7_9AGAM|nr:hypothetical protein BV25DRAFT_684768 [Artomyces pyxidatus]
MSVLVTTLRLQVWIIQELVVVKQSLDVWIRSSFLAIKRGEFAGNDRIEDHGGLIDNPQDHETADLPHPQDELSAHSTVSLGSMSQELSTYIRLEPVFVSILHQRGRKVAQEDLGGFGVRIIVFGLIGLVVKEVAIVVVWWDKLDPHSGWNP